MDGESLFDGPSGAGGRPSPDALRHGRLRLRVALDRLSTMWPFVLSIAPQNVLNPRAPTTGRRRLRFAPERRPQSDAT